MTLGRTSALIAAGAATLWTIGVAAAAEHTLMPSPQTVAIGNFNAATKPVLTIDSGDTVVIETAAAMEPAEIEQSGVISASAVPQYVRDIYREVKDRGPGPHILTGPIYVNGALPGDVLEVRILDIELAVDAVLYDAQHGRLGEPESPRHSRAGTEEGVLTPWTPRGSRLPNDPLPRLRVACGGRQGGEAE
jgi:acetamidase/formamidase